MSIGLPQATLRAQVPVVEVGPSVRSESPRSAQSPALQENPSVPIDLAAALRLAGAQSIDISLAAQRTQTALAELERANLFWLPNLYLGADYQRHDGQIQDVAGRVFTTSRSSLMVGAGPVLSFAVTDAIYGRLAAQQVVQANRAAERVAANDNMFAVAEAYFGIQQARGELTGALDALKRSEDLAKRIEQLAGGENPNANGVIPKLEVRRARTELARRQDVAERARERWQIASAELTRILRLKATALLDPTEPPQLRVTIIDAIRPVDELIPVGLTNRPELAAQQCVVQATLTRLKQEKIRPLVPSAILRPANTSPSNLLAGGVFGGGINSDVSNFGARGDFDAQLVWEFQNLGFGNRALVKARRSENQLATLELFRLQDRIAAEVAQAHAQVVRSSNRVNQTEEGVKEAIELGDQTLAAFSQTRPGSGGTITLVIRPQEAIASVQALAQAYADYYTAVADFNRAQFRLYRALGHPAQCVMPEMPPSVAPTSPPSPQTGVLSQNSENQAAATK